MLKKQNLIYVVLGILAVVVIVAIAVTSNQGKDQVKEETTIKIGVSLPLTGNLAIIGEPMRAAIDMAIEDANKASKKYKFVAIFEDDQFSPANALTNVQKLINVDQVDYLITAGSPVGMVVGPVAEQNKIIHLGIASADLAGIGSYNFNHWTPPAKQAEKVVQEFKKLGIENVGLISVNHEGSMALRNALVDEFKKEKINVLIEEKFTPGTKDFKTIWQKVENAKPQIIYFGAQTPEFEVALKQRTELGFTTPLTAIESPTYSTSPELFNGNWYVDGAVASPEFVKGFEKNTGKKIFTFSGNAYDIVRIYANAIEKFNQKPSSEQLKDALLNMGNYVGAMGPMTMDSKGNLLTEAITLKMVDGASVQVK